jgi:hypothetical protein
VEDGVISGHYETSAVGIRQATGLFYKGAPLQDFELRMSFRQTGGACEVVYRATQRDNYQPTGYSYLMWPSITGAIHETLPNASTRALILKVGDPSPKAAPEQWHDLRIVAEGNHFIHELDGAVVRDVYDPSRALQSGSLALSLHHSGAMQFKNIRLKRLNGGATR